MTTTLVLRDPYFYPRYESGRGYVDRREPCSHNCGNQPGPEGCQWCERRTPIHILSAGVHHALAQCGLKLQFDQGDYGWTYWGQRDDESGLRASRATPPGIAPPQVPSLQAPENHPVWSELRAYCAGQGLDPEFWITPAGKFPPGYGYTDDEGAQQ